MIESYKKPTLQRISITIPTNLLERMSKRLTARQRSEFIIQAIEELLAIEEQVTALDEAAGLWTDERHPELQTPEQVNQWIKALRSSWALPTTIKPMPPTTPSSHESRFS
jgi:hypothetical protein